MQIDRRHISVEHEEENPQQQMMNFPIWIDEPDAEQDAPALETLREQWGGTGMTVPTETDEDLRKYTNESLDMGIQRSPRKRQHVPNPVTPIPPRASANPSRATWVRPRYSRSYTEPQDEDVTRVPTVPQPTMWQYDSPDYNAESSLPSLSLVISDDSPPAGRPPSIEELDTLPPNLRRKQDEVAHTAIAKDLPTHDYFGLQLPSVDISERSTGPVSAMSLLGQTHKLRDEYYVAPPDIDAFIEADTVISATVIPELSPIIDASVPLQDAGRNLLVSAGIRRRGKQQEYRPSFALHPLDRVRWWLLYPGRLELLLWITGTALLVAFTCILIFVTTISLGIVSIGHTASNNSNGILTTQCTNSNCDPSTASSPGGLKITLLNTTALLTSTPVRLHGQGFSPYGRVTFTYDNNQQCYPASQRADASGTFTVDLKLTVKSSLPPGYHRVVIHDESRKQSVSLTILFTTDTGL